MQFRKNPFLPKDRPLYREHITTFVLSMSPLAGEILTFKHLKNIIQQENNDSHIGELTFLQEILTINPTGFSKNPMGIKFLKTEQYLIPVGI